jgi:hypothetical protein
LYFASIKITNAKNVELGIFLVNNDRTHLEGIWSVDRASIDSGTFTTCAPHYTRLQTEKIKGWSISFSPAAMLGALVLPASAIITLAAMAQRRRSNGETKRQFQFHHAHEIIGKSTVYTLQRRAIFRVTDTSESCRCHGLWEINRGVHRQHVLFPGTRVCGGHRLSALGGMRYIALPSTGQSQTIPWAPFPRCELPTGKR